MQGESGRGVDVAPHESPRSSSTAPAGGEGDAETAAAASAVTPDARADGSSAARRPRIDRDELVRLGGTLAVIVTMIVAFSIAQPRFMTGLNWQNIAIEMSVLLVIAIAGTFPIMIGSIDLSVGSIATLAGIIAAMALRDGGIWDTAGALPLVLLVGLAAGALNGLLFARLRIPSFLVTLGTFFALDGLASWIVHGTPIPIAATGPSDTFDGKVGSLPTIFLWAAAVLVLAVLFVRYTRPGRHLYAVGGSEPAARIAGIQVTRVKVMAFTLSGLLAGFAGYLLALHLASGSPQQGADLLLPSIGAIVIGGTELSGGVGGPQRTVIGVFLLTLLINGMQLLSVNPYLQLVIEGAVVILAVVLSREKLSVFAPVK